MAGEGVFPKAAGDIFYSSEVNNLYYNTGSIADNTGSCASNLVLINQNTGSIVINTTKLADVGVVGSYTISMDDDKEDAFVLTQGANHYICASTKNGAEKVEFGCALNPALLEITTSAISGGVPIIASNITAISGAGYAGSISLLAVSGTVAGLGASALFKNYSGTYTNNDTSQVFTDSFVTLDSLVVVSVSGANDTAGQWSVDSWTGSFTITSTEAESTDIPFDYFVTKT